MSERGRSVAVPVEVRYAETDQMGVVHHATYVIWFELARTALCAETGYHYADIERLGYLLMVTGVEARFLRPARYGDTVEVDCRLEHLGSRGMRFAYEVRRNGERLVTGATEHLWVAKATGRPCRLPDVLRPGFEALRNPGGHTGPGEPNAGEGAGE